MMTTVNEDNNDKAKVPDEFIYHSVSLVCFRITAELYEKTDLQSMYQMYMLCKLIILTTDCIRICTRTITSLFLCFTSLFVVLDIHL